MPRVGHDRINPINPVLAFPVEENRAREDEAREENGETVLSLDRARRANNEIFAERG